MRIQVLGTSAAEGWPALFCDCAACSEARALGGRNIRRRTAYAVNGDILIDFGPDIYWQSVAFGVDLARIRHLLVTHSHHDHFAPVELSWRRHGFSLVASRLALHGNLEVVKRFLGEHTSTPEELQLDLHETAPGDCFRAGSVEVAALAANHASPTEDALNFLLQADGVTALIANDTGWWEQPTWEALQRFKIDIAFLESTYGLANPEGRHHHMGAQTTVAMRDELQRRGVLVDGAQVLATHFSHNGGGSYEALRDWFAPHHIEVAYDGMVVEAE